MIEGKRLNTTLCVRIWTNTCWALEDGSQEGRELDLLGPRGGKPQNPSQSSSFLIRAANRKTCYVRMVSTLSWNRSRRPTSTSEFQPGFRRVPCAWRHSTLPYWRPSSDELLGSPCPEARAFLHYGFHIHADLGNGKRFAWGSWVGL